MFAFYFASITSDGPERHELVSANVPCQSPELISLRRKPLYCFRWLRAADELLILISRLYERDYTVRLSPRPRQLLRLASPLAKLIISLIDAGELHLI